MEGFDILSSPVTHPFASWGYTSRLLAFNTRTIVDTWITLAVLLILCIAARIALRYGVLSRYAVTQYVHQFMNMTTQTLGTFVARHCIMICALFSFLVLNNTISVLPFIDEPTKDLNTALAFGIVAFVYIQYYAIKAHGLWPYIKSFFQPIPLFLPLNIIGKLTTVISMSFRLFGNIFGGAVINKIYFGFLHGSILFESLGIFTGMNLLITLFFGVFEGCLQAFVFTILTITYLSTALAGDH